MDNGCFAIYETLMAITEKQSIFLPETAPLDVTFLVAPGASIMCVASAIDPLRAANRIAGEQLYRWTVVSPDGTNPLTTSGLPVTVSGKFDANTRHETLIVIAGFGTAPFAKGPFIAGLAKAGRRARAIGGIEAGTWLLGHAGLLDGRASTTHFEDMEDFRAAFPESDVRPERFVIDGPLFTCGGASPAFDLMLHLIRSRNGVALAMNVASVFLYEQSRAAADTQPLVSLGQLEQLDPRISTAIRLMETHVDAPLTMTAIAVRTGVTTRTLETTFNRLIGETPAHYYLGLRLAAARKMVTDTKLPLTEIAARTGFSSAAIFSRAFKTRFAKAPTELR
jgi:AraC family transcriptional regulator, glycine betaine-responsive activator